MPVDLAKVDMTRTHWPFLRDRRIDAYGNHQTACWTDSCLKPLAWITGANGLIGNYLVQTAPRFAPPRRMRALTRPNLTWIDFAAVRREFQKDSPQLVIHCAALTHTPTCEKNPDAHAQAEYRSHRPLAELAVNIPFIFFSTDLVFDGSERKLR